MELNAVIRGKNVADKLSRMSVQDKFKMMCYLIGKNHSELIKSLDQQGLIFRILNEIFEKDVAGTKHINRILTLAGEELLGTTGNIIIRDLLRFRESVCFLILVWAMGSLQAGVILSILDNREKYSRPLMEEAVR